MRITKWSCSRAGAQHKIQSFCSREWLKTASTCSGNNSQAEIHILLVPAIWNLTNTATSPLQITQNLHVQTQTVLKSQMMLFFTLLHTALHSVYCTSWTVTITSKESDQDGYPANPKPNSKLERSTQDFLKKTCLQPKTTLTGTGLFTSKL